MSGAPQVTKNGYRVSEVVSALQKEIRRGNEETALFWCLELATVMHLRAWRRLATIAAEDVGMGDPQAIVVIRALWESYVQIHKEGAGLPDDNFYAMAVLYLCRTAKSRLVDEFKNAILNDIAEGWRPEIPEYAKDVHTGAKGATQADWWMNETEAIGSHERKSNGENEDTRYRERAMREVKPVKVEWKEQRRLFDKNRADDTEME